MLKASIAVVLTLFLAGCSSAGFDVADFQRTDSDVEEGASDTDPGDVGRDSRESDSHIGKDGSDVGHDDAAAETIAADTAASADTASIDSGSDTAIDTGIDTGTLATDSGVGGEDAIVCARWCAGSGSLPLGSACSSASDCCSELCDFCAGGPCCKPQDTASSWCGGKDGTPEWCPGVGRCVP